MPLIVCNDCQETSQAIEAKKAIHDASCIAMGVYTPTKIKKIRKACDMDQVEFSRLIGVGDLTVRDGKHDPFFQQSH